MNMPRMQNKTQQRHQRLKKHTAKSNTRKYCELVSQRGIAW